MRELSTASMVGIILFFGPIFIAGVGLFIAGWVDAIKKKDEGVLVFMSFLSIMLFGLILMLVGQ